ncbi:hypothetical protein D3C72_879570 [compost metagenome]
MRAQLVIGDQAQIDIERFVGLWQRQHEVAARQRPFGLWLVGAGVALLDQLVTVEYVEIEL